MEWDAKLNSVACEKINTGEDVGVTMYRLNSLWNSDCVDRPCMERGGCVTDSSRSACTARSRRFALVAHKAGLDPATEVLSHLRPPYARLEQSIRLLDTAMAGYRERVMTIEVERTEALWYYNRSFVWTVVDVATTEHAFAIIKETTPEKSLRLSFDLAALRGKALLFAHFFS